MRFFILFLVFCNANYISLGQVQFTSSPLPILFIDTKGKLIQDEPKIDAVLQVLDNGPGIVNHITDIPTGYNGRIGIEYRGSTSQSFPKKPYGFETRDETGADKSVSLLGMPEESDWVLNATYNDKSLVRDAMTYILAGQIMPYAPRVRMVELVVNGSYEGIYLLTEKIKRDEDRVNIAGLDNDDNSGDDVTGGYILKLDKQTGSPPSVSWLSVYQPYPGAWQKVLVQLDYPEADEVTLQQVNYVRKHMNEVESAIASPAYADPNNGYRKYIDTASLIDFIILNELGKNPDAYRLSTYFYKVKDSDGGKIHFGPVWDFNLAYGNVNYCTGPSPEGLVISTFNSVCNSHGWVVHFWWKRFIQDEILYLSLKNRWKDLRQSALSNHNVHAVTDSLIALLEPVQQRNFQRWPILGRYVWPNSFVGASWQQETLFFKDWVTKRLAYLDEIWSMTELPPVSKPTPILSVKPNPAQAFIEIEFAPETLAYMNLSVLDVLGRHYVAEVISASNSTTTLDISTLPPGVYVVTASAGDQKQIVKFVKQ